MYNLQVLLSTPVSCTPSISSDACMGDSTSTSIEWYHTNELPTDLQSTLLHIQSQWPYTTTLLSVHHSNNYIQRQPPPIMLQSHIYHHLDRTVSRTDIDHELMQCNTIRKFILMNKIVAYVFTNDYIAKLQQLINIDIYENVLLQHANTSTQLQHTQPAKKHISNDQSTKVQRTHGNNDVELLIQRNNQWKRRRITSTDDFNSSTDIQLIEDNFSITTDYNTQYDHCLLIYTVITTLLPQCTTSTVSHNTLYNKLYKSIESQYKCSTFDSLLNFMIHNNILLQSQSESEYTFTIPYCSVYLSDLVNGRKEVISLLQRKQYRMVSYRQFEKLKLKNSRLSVRYIVDSLIGDYTVTAHKTGAGDVLSLTQQHK